MAVNDSILIIGPPDSGKTVFLAQFFTRVLKRKSSIKLLKMPANIRAIADAQTRLASGEEPIPTPTEANVELILSIDVDGKMVDLICPDYGGEQVIQLTQFMEVDTNWEVRVHGSDRWIMFIRPSKITRTYDLSLSCYERIEGAKSPAITPPRLSDQSKFIELLQILLHSRDQGLGRTVDVPKLLIVLTCWDELKTEMAPVQVLQEKLPMLLNFVETVWAKEAFAVLGLSAQGFPLDTQEAKDRYQDELPENFGYLIDFKGVEDRDVTNLVKTALQQ
jgi:hypothetical protein